MALACYQKAALRLPVLPSRPSMLRGRQGMSSAGSSHVRAALTKLTLPGLSYDYGALEPVISGELLEIHHSKHHQAYVNNYNKALEEYEEASLKNDFNAQALLLPLLKFNAGGHLNHAFFWQNLAPISEGGGEPPSGKLAIAIDKEFGSLENFISKFNAVGAGVQGSGWVWLGIDKDSKSISIQTTGNQDLLTGLEPLLTVDVWEHAYYLKYKNVRPEYLKNIWKIINWKDVAARYEALV